MKRLFTALLASLLLLVLSAPAWAQKAASSKQPCLVKNDTHYGHYKFKTNRHKLKVLKQFRELKKTYSRSFEDAKAMFLEYLGSSLPSSDTDVQQIRDEYEQQIAALNITITSYQQQLAALETSSQQQLTDLETAYQQQIAALTASHQQEIVALTASHQQEIADLTASHQAALDDASVTCGLQIEAAYDDGLTAGTQACSNPSTGEAPQLIGSWSTGSINPNAITMDSSGNVFVLDTANKTVVQYDNSGTQIVQWSSSMLQIPVDMAVNSQGDVFILDTQSGLHLQRYSSNGSQYDWALRGGSLIAPTGLYVDSQNAIYITDEGGVYGGRVLVYNSSGTFLKTIGEVPELTGEAYYDVAVNEQDSNIYLLTGSKVAIFDPDGNFLKAWDGGFSEPSGMSIGSQGEIFVADKISHEIYQYDSDGNLIYTFGSNDLQDPGRLAVDATGRLYIGDYADQQINIFQ